MNCQDKRVIKTKKTIRDALIRLLADKPVNKITVTEVAEAAGVNRKTFYAHYESVDSILAELEDDIIEDIRELLKSCMIEEYGMKPQYFLQLVNTVYNSNPKFFENLVSSRHYHFLADKLKKILKQQIIESLNVSEKQQIEIDFQIEYYLSGASAVYVEWFRKGKPCSFEEVTDILGRILGNMDFDVRFTEI